MDPTQWSVSWETDRQCVKVRNPNKEREKNGKGTKPETLRRVRTSWHDAPRNKVMRWVNVSVIAPLPSFCPRNSRRTLMFLLEKPFLAASDSLHLICLSAHWRFMARSTRRGCFSGENDSVCLQRAQIGQSAKCDLEDAQTE